MHGHTIVCGDDALAMRIIEELSTSEVAVVPLLSPDELDSVSVDTAAAIICASDDDALNLEIALLARQANPQVRVVARLANTVLREAMSDGNGPGAILDVADLAAPSVVEACLERTTHTIAAAGIDFVVSGTSAPRDGSLRDIYGDLAPVAIVRSEDADIPGELIACPGRDVHVRKGDWTAMMGTAEELAAQGIRVAKPIASQPKGRSLLDRLIDSVRAVRDDLNPTTCLTFFERVAGGGASVILSA